MPDGSKNLRPDMDLDEVDRKIVDELQSNGRITNAELAERVGVAASTCIARVRSLVTRRIITGFTASVDPRAMGLGLQVLISVTVRSGARQRISEMSDSLRALPEVMQLFFLGGVEDFIIHLAARDSDHVRDFVMEHLSAHPAVSSTRTSIVFSHHQNPVRSA
ncbi:Lrp/AsnC family transcriptional regulator [Leucobacter luti]|uniref:AsnC family transcriptional regulator n=1 Tax=Leucobacter luti TaxID=340320 RepID=A0A4R6RYM5_9MICO|nr:Lrp/AsnC family transcriptional regulator [Leucobacter luti]MCW2288206.1 DNA-binding Lrp family transcriptional regulator [Leucobacter luti]QYM75835.1 Lrp/AsnC family transcriptional regulator [Leucobacter luti]TCK45635.1 AsnC family transcriptional regulator [Leucobacter luti]TDP91455.1 AsnC family transcriptional regulator [Leucobacter luti]